MMSILMYLRLSGNLLVNSIFSLSVSTLFVPVNLLYLTLKEMVLGLTRTFHSVSDVYRTEKITRSNASFSNY